MCAIDFLVSLGRKAGDDEIASIVEKPIAGALITLPHDEGGPIGGGPLRDRFGRFPQSFSARQLDCVKAAVLVESVHYTFVHKWLHIYRRDAVLRFVAPHKCGRRSIA